MNESDGKIVTFSNCCCTVYTDKNTEIEFNYTQYYSTL